MVEVVEKWNQHVGPHGIRQDLYGFIDVLAIEPGEVGCLGVQCGSTGSMAGHIRKITEDCYENARRFLLAQNRLEVWEWRKVKVKRGGKAMRWAPRIRELTLEDFRDE